MTIEERLTNLENLVQSFINSQSNESQYNTWDKEGLSKQIEDVTPYMDSQRAYIGDSLLYFNDVKGTQITAYCETDSGLSIPTVIERMGNTVIVKFEILKEVATVTISAI